MDTKQKLEIIKLIHEFMGEPFGLEYPMLDYQNSWEYLMPVVGKITQNEQFIEVDEREHLMDIVPYAHLEDTFDAVVNFINWYNKQEITS